MEFPKMPWNKDRRRKLTKEDIKHIKALRTKGNSQREIAKEMGISKYAVAYWLMPLAQRQERTKKAREKYKDKQDPIKEKERKAESMKYKKNVQREEMLRYQNSLKARLYPERKEKIQQNFRDKRLKLGVLLWKKMGRKFIENRYKNRPEIIQRILDKEPLLILLAEK